MSLPDVMIYSMLKKLRRWHFDLALFLGLAIFSWAYWYSKPRPVWTTEYKAYDDARIKFFIFLGYSQDSQTFYTTWECHETHSDWPIPHVQKWSTHTGELIADYPLTFPEEDHFLLKVPERIFANSYTVTLCADPRYLLVSYNYSRQKDYKHKYVRLYHVDGNPVGKGIELKKDVGVEYLNQPEVADRHWLFCGVRNAREQNYSSSLIDLDSGNTLRTFLRESGETLSQIHLLPGGRLLLLMWIDQNTGEASVEVVNWQTGEHQSRIKLPAAFHHLLTPLDETHWVLGVANRQDELSPFYQRLQFYVYDPNANTLQDDDQHPLQGHVSLPNRSEVVRPSTLLTISALETERHDSQFFQVILSWLARVGIACDNKPYWKYHVAELATGKPLKQVSGVPGGQNWISPDMRSIITDRRSPKGEPSLSLYLIPHYLWQPSLSWLQWLSWLLVVPWPLRYFVQPHLAPGSSSRGAI